MLQMHTTFLTKTGKTSLFVIAIVHIRESLISFLFQVLTEAVVTRVLFADAAKNKDLTSTGVEFIHRGKTYSVHAKKEVVLSTGYFTPSQIMFFRLLLTILLPGPSSRPRFLNSQALVDRKCSPELV
jgi:hypothetical protein